MPRAAELLSAWEAGQGRATSPDLRAELLHALARPDAGRDELLATGVGARDAALFELRRRLFGDRLSVRLSCPACRAELEFDAGISDIVGDTASAGNGDLPAEADASNTLRTGEWAVEFRMPTTADLAAAAERARRAGGDDPMGAARTALLERVVLTAERDGTPTPVEQLPDLVVSRLAERVEAADPVADLDLNAECPECGEKFGARFDIAEYLWIELDAWARDLLEQVHALATAYGWSEADILALSPLRRAFYLEAAGYA